MKKIFTLATAVLMTVAVMAADRRPTVTLQGGKDYEVVIDGRTVSMNQFSQFSSKEIKNLRGGKHTISVYEIPRRFFAVKSKRMISTASFFVRGNDVQIRIDQNGKLNIKEVKQFKGYDDRDQRGNGWKNGHDDKDDRDYRNQGGQKNRF